MNPEPEEYALALRARDGDAEALERLVERTRLRLFSLAYAELRHYDDAHDAVAATLLQVCRHVTELREPERVRAWMNSILRNECRRLRQRRDVVLPLEAAEGPAEEGAPSLRLDIERALRRLPGEEARALRLFYLAELPVREIARRTGRSEGTIKSWLHRGRRRLATAMEGYAPMARRSKAPTPAAAPAARPAPVATLLHTDLDAGTVQRVSEALAAVGYEPRVVTPTDLASLTEQLKETEFLVLDEWLQGRPAIELLIHLKSDPETEAIPVCILCADPADFTVSAFWGAGVDRLVNKKNPADMARLEDAFRYAYFSWRRFTERARWAFFRAQEAAAFLGSPAIDTEHLLLGLFHDRESVAVRLLKWFGVDRDMVRLALGADVLRASSPVPIQMRVTPAAQQAIVLARKEARAMKQSYIGTEHLLLGLIEEGSGEAARVLAGLGVSAERARAELQAAAFETAAPAGEEREGRAGTVWELFTTLDLGRPLPSPEQIPTTLPLLACRDKVYFPRMMFPLFVGRPKTVEALKEAEAGNRTVLITCQKQFGVDDPGPGDLYAVGTVARVVHLVELPDRSIRVMLDGIARARIVEYRKTDPFFEVRVEPIAEQAGEEAEALVQRVGTEFRAELGAKVPHGMFAELLKLNEPGPMADLVTPYLPLRTSDQQAVLETLPPVERLEKVAGYLEAMRAGTLEGEEPEAPGRLHGHAPWWQLATTAMLTAPLPAPPEIPATLPLLAIRDKVYFPRMGFPLFAGREKSVRALEAAEAADGLVLLVAQKQVHVDAPRPEDLFAVGTVARVLQMLPLPDGTVRVLVEGIGRARVREYLQTEAFFQVRVEVLPEEMETGEAAAERVRQFLTDYRPDLTAQIPHDHFEQLVRLEEPGRLADLITPYLPLDITAQQAILEMESPAARLERIRQYLDGVRNLLR